MNVRQRHHMQRRSHATPEQRANGMFSLHDEPHVRRYKYWGWAIVAAGAAPWLLIYLAFLYFTA